MIREVDEDQTLLDIEILAVQIEEERRARAARQAEGYTQRLQQLKMEEYSRFKKEAWEGLKGEAPYLAGWVGAGVVVTRTLVLGTIVGLASWTMLPRLWSNSSTPQKGA